MSILVIGLGSMGKRRVRDLLHLQKDKVVGWDIREDRRLDAEKKFGICTFASLEDALQETPRAIVISTPPDLHMQYAHLACDLDIPFFTEASVTLDGVKELVDKVKQKPALVAAPSCTMRFHPAIAILKDLVSRRVVGDKAFFLYHSGQYLPDWHPYEDYRSYYVSRRETGGCREIVTFEWIWLTSIFGPIHSGIVDKAKVSSLEADIDDVYQMQLRFADGTYGQITVDVVSRIPTRKFAVIGDKGTINWDFFVPEINVYLGEEKRTTSIDVTTGDRFFQYEDMYVSEMKAFLQAINGERSFPHNFESDLVLLTFLQKSENAAKR
jgi:predicted dehydrogenase